MSPKLGVTTADPVVRQRVERRLVRGASAEIATRGQNRGVGVGRVVERDRFLADILRKAKGEPDAALMARVVGPELEWLCDAHGLEFSLVENFSYPGRSALLMHGLPPAPERSWWTASSRRGDGGRRDPDLVRATSRAFRRLSRRSAACARPARCFTCRVLVVDDRERSFIEPARRRRRGLRRLGLWHDGLPVGQRLSGISLGRIAGSAAG